MPWQLHLFVFSYGSLLCLVESSVYRSGLQHDVPISSLAAAGCVPCYEATYESATNSKDITSCTGPFLFVGMQEEVMPVLKVGALSSVDVFRTESSRSAPYLSNGVYWHFMKGCSFGFKAVEYDHNFTEEECRELFARTEDDVSWDIDQSVGCTSLGDSKPQSTVDTSNFKKHVYNCPEYPASVLFSEQQQERGGGGHEARIKGREEVGIVDSLQLSPVAPYTTKATLYTSQEYTAAPAPSTKPLLAAVTRTIESILNESDLKVNFLDAYNSVNKTKMTYTVDLPESKSGSALLLLNASISDNSFSSTLSKILGIPITTKGSYKRYTTIVWMNTATSTSASPLTGIAMIWVLVIPFALLFVWVRACVYVRMSKNAPRPEPVSVEAYASILETESGRQLSGILATRLPSAEASIMFPESTVYGIATAIVPSESV